MSEISTYISSSPARPGGLYPQPGRRVAILPDAGGDTPVPRGHDGLLAVSRRDPGLMLGYWRRPEATAAAFRGDWFVTGDRAAMAADGAVTHLGRADDLINAGGYRVSPAEVEAALASHPGVAEAAAFERRLRPGVSIVAAAYVPRAAPGPARRSRPALQRPPRALQMSESLRRRRRAAAEPQRQAPAPPAQRPAMTRLEIISDPVCPWCYLGAANLMRALAEHPGPHPLALTWRPYQLDPGLPPEGADRAAYLAAKFPDPAGIEAAHDRLAAMGAESGIAFNFDRITRAPNTLDAHRVIRWAEPDGLQTRTAMTLFRRYFELGQDISDPAILAEAAGEAGLDAAVIARLLQGDADRAELRAEADAAREMGVTGVPTFLLGGRYAITGAQPTAFWTDLVARIEAAA